MRIPSALLSAAAFVLTAVSSASTPTETDGMQKDYLEARRAMISTPAAQNAIINNSDLNGGRINIAVTLAALSKTAEKHGKDRVLEWSNQGYADSAGHGELAPALAMETVKLIAAPGRDNNEIMQAALKKVDNRVIDFLGKAAARVLAALGERNATYQPFATCLRNQWGKMADKCRGLFDAVVGRHSPGDRPNPYLQGPQL